jgi:hypothetical protein
MPPMRIGRPALLAASMLAVACGAPARSPDADTETPNASTDCRPVPTGLLGHHLSLSDATKRSAEWEREGPGTIDEALVRTALRRKHRALQNCYDRERACNPHLNGVLALRLRIDRSGRIEVTVEEDDPALAAAGVTACAVERLESLSFAATPPAGGEVAFRFPLTFLPPTRRQ